MRNRILAVCLIVAISMGSSQAFGATAKAGGACAKVGLKSGSLICAKVSGKLKWKIVKKAQTIKYSIPTQASIADKSVNFPFSASSKLVVSATSLTLNVCTLGKSVILFTGTPGLCRVSLIQNGNAYYLAAKAVLVELKVFGTNIIDLQLPGPLLLAQANYQLSATTSSNLPITFSSATTDICTVVGSTLTLLTAGTCKVTASQGGSDLIPAATPVSEAVEILTNRVTVDSPDTVSGFQVKAIYVVPSDGTDNSYDRNGYLAGILSEGNSYLNGQIGQTLPIDRSSSGYDIQYLKSQYSTEYLRTHVQSTSPETTDGHLLLSEIKAMENPGDNRKDYIFFIDVPGFSGSFCGMADTPGMSAVVALQNISDTQICRGKSAPFFENYTSKTWVHELMHNFGVSHTLDDPCDLMAGKPETPGTCTSDIKYTMDKEKTRYVGASTQGQDVLQLRVWQGYTDRKDMKADCILNPTARVDGIGFAYCPTGTRPIGELSFCWSSVDSVTLEEMVGGVWVSLGAGSYYSQMWGGDLSGKACSDPKYPVAVWKEVTVDTPGIRHYRWLVNGQVSEMNVIWVK